MPSQSAKSVKQESSSDLVFDFQKNSGGVYKLEYQTRISFNKSITTINNSVILDTELNYRVFDKQKDYAIVGFELSNIYLSFGNSELEKKLSKLYSELFFIKVANDGRFLEYILPRSDDDLKGILELFSLFQVVLKKEGNYTTTETSSTGEYLSSYKVINNTIHKSRKKYISLKHKKHKLIFTNSNYNIVMASKDKWFKSLSVEEAIDAINNDVKVLTSKTTLKMRKLDIPKDKTLKIWSERRDVKIVLKEHKELLKKTNKKSFWVEEKIISQKKYIKENHITLNTLLKKIDKSNHISNYNELRKYITLYPETTKQILVIIKNETTSLSSGLINVLQMADTKESKEMLVKIIKDDSISSLNRQRASIALGDIKTPDKQSIKALVDMVENKEDSDISNSALLSLGSASLRVDEEQYKEIQNQISELITNGDDEKIKRIAIIAATNSNVDDYYEEIKDSLYSDSKAIKFSAIEALGKMDSEDSTKLLVYEYTNSNDNATKVKAIKALSDQQADMSIVTQLQNDLSSNLDTKVKSEVLWYLSKTSKEFPSNKKYLKNELKSQTDPSLIKEMIRSIKNI